VLRVPRVGLRPACSVAVSNLYLHLSAPICTHRAAARRAGPQCRSSQCRSSAVVLVARRKINADPLFVVCVSCYRFQYNDQCVRLRNLTSCCQSIERGKNKCTYYVPFTPYTPDPAPVRNTCTRLTRSAQSQSATELRGEEPFLLLLTVSRGEGIGTGKFCVEVHLMQWKVAGPERELRGRPLRVRPTVLRWVTAWAMSWHYTCVQRCVHTEAANTSIARTGTC
jgi:hypothetical protein